MAYLPVMKVLRLGELAGQHQRAVVDIEIVGKKINKNAVRAHTCVCACARVRARVCTGTCVRVRVGPEWNLAG